MPMKTTCRSAPDTNTAPLISKAETPLELGFIAGDYQRHNVYFGAAQYPSWPAHAGARSVLSTGTFDLFARYEASVESPFMSLSAESSSVPSGVLVSNSLGEIGVWMSGVSNEAMLDSDFILAGKYDTEEYGSDTAYEPHVSGLVLAELMQGVFDIPVTQVVAVHTKPMVLDETLSHELELDWIEANLDRVYEFQGKCLAISSEGIIAVGETLNEVAIIAESMGFYHPLLFEVPNVSDSYGALTV